MYNTYKPSKRNLLIHGDSRNKISLEELGVQTRQAGSFYSMYTQLPINLIVCQNIPDQIALFMFEIRLQFS